MPATITRLRSNTPARWQAALQRALDRNVSVRQLLCGAWVATSDTDATTAYLVTETGCECVAAQHGDPVCAHRAALRHRVGRLSLDPEPTPPAAPVVATLRCYFCSGSGLDSALFGTGPTAEYRDIPCCACGGTGQVNPADVDSDPDEAYEEREDWAA